jgi:dTDP-4-dehydrorhamnose reductase
MGKLKRTLIFGGAGQVGTELINFAPNWADLRIFNRDSIDLKDLGRLRSIIRDLSPELIINAAAYTAVDNAENDSELAYLINAEVVKAMAEEASRLNCKILHYSTDYVFDGQSSLPYQSHSEKNPLSVYGKSKSLGEDYLAEILPLSEMLIIRTAWVYGHTGKNFVRTMLKIMGDNKKIRVVIDQVGTPTSAENLARATWLALENEVNGIHHFTDAGVASWYDFAVAIARIGYECKVFSQPVEIEPVYSKNYPQLARRPQFSLLDKTEFWSVSKVPIEHWQDSLKRHLEKTYQ